jgi:hypothetical protein
MSQPNLYDIEDAEALLAEVSDVRNQIQLYKIFIKHFGDLNVAAVLSEIFTWSNYYRKRSLPYLPGTGWFWRTYTPSIEQTQGQGDSWQERLSLSEEIVRKCIKRLKDEGYIETDIKKANGNPTLHYRFVTSKLLEILNTCKMQGTKPKKKEKQIRQKEGKEPLSIKGTLTNKTAEITPKNNNNSSPAEAVVVFSQNDFERLYELVPLNERSTRLENIIHNALERNGADAYNIVESNIRYGLSHHTPVNKNGEKQASGGLLCQAILNDYAKGERKESADQAEKKAMIDKQRMREAASEAAVAEQERNERLQIQHRLFSEDENIQQAIRVEARQRAEKIGVTLHLVDAIILNVAQEYYRGEFTIKC